MLYALVIFEAEDRATGRSGRRQGWAGVRGRPAETPEGKIVDH
jgi:hypothetical protein